MSSHSGSPRSGAVAVGDVATEALLSLNEASAAHARAIARPGGVSPMVAAIDAKSLAAVATMINTSAAAASAQALSDSISAQVKVVGGGVAAQIAASMPRIAVAESLAASLIVSSGHSPMAALSRIVAQSEAVQAEMRKALTPPLARNQALLEVAARQSRLAAASAGFAVLPEGRRAPEFGHRYAIPPRPAPDPLRFRNRAHARSGRGVVSALRRLGLGDAADLLAGGWENLERRTPGAVSFAAHAAVEVIDRTLKRVSPEEHVQTWLIESGRMAAEKPRRATFGERLEYTALLLGGLLGDELAEIGQALVQRRRVGQGGKHASEGSLGSAARLLQLAEMFVEIVVVEGQVSAAHK